MKLVPQTKSLVFDLYASIVRHDGGWIAIADVVDLLGQLGVEEQAVRSSVSRLRDKDLLGREVRDGAVGYGLTAHALAVLADGDSRIYGRLEPPDIAEGWVLITFSVPEDRRADRHQMRRGLSALGFGNLGPGMWIAPHRMMERATQMVVAEGLEGYTDIFAAHYAAFDDLQRLVSRCWDIQHMGDLYTAYIAAYEPVLERWAGRRPSSHPGAAFADFISAVHDWRRMPFLDPGLPRELLPGDWEGERAAKTFNAINALLFDAARAHVAAVRRA